MVHASISIFMSVGLSAGVRALPVFSLSRARASSPESLEVSISKCLKIAAASLSVESSNFVR
jgi:hypothetical protein